MLCCCPYQLSMFRRWYQLGIRSTSAESAEEKKAKKAAKRAEKAERAKNAAKLVKYSRVIVFVID
jgi:hypothetical protein